MKSIKVSPILSAHLLNSPVAIFLQIHFILHLAGDKTFILAVLLVLVLVSLVSLIVLVHLTGDKTQCQPDSHAMSRNFSKIFGGRDATT